MPIFLLSVDNQTQGLYFQVILKNDGDHCKIYIHEIVTISKYRCPLIYVKALDYATIVNGKYHGWQCLDGT